MRMYTVKWNTQFSELEKQPLLDAELGLRLQSIHVLGIELHEQLGQAAEAITTGAGRLA